MALGFDASRQLFELGGSAEGGGEQANGRVVSLLRGDVDLAGEFCHGIEAALGIGVSGSASATGKLLRVAGADASVDASASAGARVRAQLPLDLFDAAGLIVHAHAAAEANISARIEIDLLFDRAVDLARERLDGVTFDLFLLLLEEARIGAEGFAIGSAGAAAQVQATLAFRLEEGDARFEAALDGSASWGVGGGMGVGLAAELDDPYRLYRRTVERIVSAVIDELDRGLDGAIALDARAVNETARLMLPIAFDAIYLFAQGGTLSRLGNDEVLRAFLTGALEQIQVWLLQKIADLAVQLLLDGVAEALGNEPLENTERDRLIAELRRIAQVLRNGTGSGTEILDTFGRMVDVAEAVGLVIDDEAEQIVSVGWCALAVCLSIQGLIEGGGVRTLVRLPGAPPTATQSAVRLPRPPGIVRRALAARAGATVAETGPQPGPSMFEAVDYLVGGVASGTLLATDQALRRPLEDVAELFGVTPDELIESVFTIAGGDGLQDTALFEAFRRLIGQASRDLATAVESGLDGAPAHVREWAQQTVAPSLAMIDAFVFDDVLAFLASSGSERSRRRARLSTASSTLVIRLLGQQFVALSDIAFEAFRDAVQGQCRALARAVRGNASHPLVSLASGSLLPVLPGPPASDTVARLRTQRLIAAVLEGLALSFGPQVWTATRRIALRDRQLALLDAAASLSDSDADWFERLSECTLPPAVQGPMTELVEAGLAPLAESMEVLLRHVLPALNEFFLDVGLEAVQRLDRLLLETLRILVERVQGFREAWNNSNEVIASMLISAENAADQVNAALVELATLLEPLQNAAAFRRSTRRQLISLLTARPLDDLPPDSELDFSEGAAMSVFDIIPTLAWETVSSLVTRVLDGALQLTGGNSVTLGRLRSLQRRVQGLVDELLSELSDRIPLLGTVLRRVLGIELLETILTRALRAQRLENDARQLATQAESASRIASARITIDSPAQQTPRDVGGFYGAPVPLRVHITRAGRHGSVLSDSELQPVGVLLNGREVALPNVAWIKTRAGGELVHRLGTGDGLRPGLNALEVAAVSAAGEPLRQLVLFGFDAGSDTQPSAFELVAEATTINSPGNDHESLNKERVTLRWVGTAPIGIGGWRLTDANGRRGFVFPDHTLQPGERVSVVTGHAAAQEPGTTAFSWQQSAAVWNNRGDTIRLIDERNVVRFEQRV